MNLTTKEAFEALTSQRGWYIPLGYTESKASGMKHSYKLGRLSIDSMEQALEDAGWRVVQEKRWKPLANR